MSSANSESLTSPLLIWMPCISFCCMIAEAKISGTMLNNSSESEQLCLVPDHREEAQFSSIEDDISCGSFVNGLYDVELCSFYPYFVEGFNQEWMLFFVFAFSASIERII